MKALTVAYMGCIDKRYSRNKTNIDGLRQAGVTVSEIIVDTPVTPLNASNHLAAISLLKRITRKVLIFPELYHQRHALMQADALFVGYPGQFDMPIAWIMAKALNKTLIFDPVILMFNALANDIGVIQQQSLKTRVLKEFERLVMHMADIVIASTIEQKEFFIQEMGLRPDKIAVAYLAADDSIYKPAFSKSSDGKCRVVYYGLYTPLHGVPHILKAAELLKDRQDIIFQMVGKGQIFPEMKQLAESKKLTNVEFYPEINESNAKELLQNADVFLGFMESNSTVLREIPNKVYQGLALGKTVVTSDSPAIRSVFEDGHNIVLVEAGNGRSLASALTKLANNPSRREKIAHAAYQTFNQHYTPKAIGQVMKHAVLNYLNHRSSEYATAS